MLTLLKTSLCLSLGLGAAAFLAAAQGGAARPGTVNYAEGQVTLDGRLVSAKSLGSIEVSPGHVLHTGQGRAEMLLTPGAYLRLGENTEVRMVSPSLTDTRVELLNGEAMVEVDQISSDNRLVVTDHGADVRLLKNGVYRFTSQPLVAVYDGKAQVLEDDHAVEVGKGRELLLSQNAALKTQKFDRKQTDELYAFSRLRSGYLSEASLSSAQALVNSPAPWWGYGLGWYWNPWFDSWAFLPGDGFFYNPFGFGFFSPGYVYYNPGLRYGYLPGRGFGGTRGVTGVRAVPGIRAPMGRGMTMGRMGGGMTMGRMGGGRGR